MSRLRIKFLSFSVLTLFICGCVTRASLRQVVQPVKVAYKPESSSLSDYIRSVYKLSSEASKQTEQRTALLSEVPDVAGLVTRAEQDPSDVDARSRIVSEYMSRKLYWAAYELLTNAMVVKPNDAEINLNLAIIWDAWGEYDLALQHGERAIVNGAASAQAYETLGRIHLHRNASAEAIVWYNRALQQAPSAPVLANLGYAHMLRSEWQEAKHNLEGAIQLDSTLQEAHNNLALILAKSGEDVAALQHLMAASRSAVAFNNMGVIYLQEKKGGQAEDFFRASLRLEPNYEVAQRNLEAVQISTLPPPIIHLPSFGTDGNTESNGIVSSNPSVQTPTGMAPEKLATIAEPKSPPFDISDVDMQLEPVAIQEPTITLATADQTEGAAVVSPEKKTRDLEPPSIVSESVVSDAAQRIVGTSSKPAVVPPAVKPQVEIYSSVRGGRLSMASIAGLVLVTGFLTLRRKLGE